MPRNAANFYANSRPSAEKYVSDPWLDMGHVEARIAKKYGTQAAAVTEALKQGERSRYANRTAMLHTIPAGRDVFQRNLRTLSYIADGKVKVNDRAGTVATLYRDALDDLSSLYPEDRKYNGVSPREVWRHILDAVRDEAAKG